MALNLQKNDLSKICALLFTLVTLSGAVYKACTEMDIQTSLVTKSEIPNPQNGACLSKEVLSQSHFNLVAEPGSYLGLTLGLSLAPSDADQDRLAANSEW